MTSLLDHLARLFVEAPAAPAQDERVGEVRTEWLPPRPAAAPRPAMQVAGRPAVAVLCAPKDARVAGGAAALAVAQLCGVGCAVVAEWTGDGRDPGADRPAGPAARRATAALRAAGHAARVSGRLVRVTLPADERAAADGARALLLTAGPPVVLVVAGPRGDPLGDVVATAGAVVLAIRPDADAELTALALAELGPAAAVVELPSSPGAAALARSGAALVAPLRAPFVAALRAA